METMEGGEVDRKREIEHLTAYLAAGDLASAENLARSLLATDPGDGEASYLLAQIVFKQGRAEEAIEPMRSALDADPMRSPYHNDHGVMLASLGRLDEAAAAYGMAAALDRNNVDARFNLALSFFRTGQKARARAELDSVLAQRPDLPEALALDGEWLRAEGRPAEAVEAFTKAIGLGLETSETYVNLGLALEDVGRGEEAFQAFQSADRVDGGNAAASFHLGNFYRGKGANALAERFFRQTLALCPNFAEANNNLGLLLQESGQWEKAAEHFNKALASNPGMSAAHINLGNVRGCEGWMEGAIDSFKRAIEINPDSPDAWNNLGLIHLRLRRLDEAETEIRRALEIRPDYPAADLNLGFLLLLRGDFSEGWPHYESRWQMPGMAEKRPRLSQPEWAGEALGNRTLLVYNEQGLGDNLQFVRYLPLLRKHHPAARIHFPCMPQLHRLFESCASAWGIEMLPLVTADNLPPVDVQVALLSLPRWMGTTLANIPADVPYIAPPPSLVEKWAARLDPLPGKKVGVVWASGEIYTMHRSRTVRLEQLGPLFDVGGISWVSLQKGNGASQIVSEGLSGLILNMMDEVEDFADTAAIVANLDLVISVDTSVPHLVGAMGRPIWLLDRFDADWRWLIGREDSPWYPTMRIFRQRSFGDWDSVIPRVAEALAEWVAQDGNGQRPAAPEASVSAGGGGVKTPSPNLALKLNLGCGNRKMQGFINVDRVKMCRPDRVVDLEKTPWPWEDGSVGEIRLIHVLEHLGQQADVFLSIVKEMYRVCRDGARIEITVPDPRSDAFFGDPTHVRPITGNVLNLFNQRLNREWASEGVANTPLGLILGVDFEIESATHTLDSFWQEKLSSGRVNQTEIIQAARQYNNVIMQSTFVWRARKPAYWGAAPNPAGGNDSPRTPAILKSGVQGNHSPAGGV